MDEQENQRLTQMVQEMTINDDISIGQSDFKQLIESGRLYVDKTFLIEQICRASNDTVLFTRPRRFGKSLTINDINVALFFLEIRRGPFPSF